MKRENIIKLQRSLDNLIEIHNQLILSNKFNEALNVMKNIEAITRQLKDLDLPIIIEEEKYEQFLDWYNVLKFFIETKQSQLIELDYSDRENEKKHRATGKTTALLKLSNDYNIPILVSNYKSEYSDLKNKADALGLHITMVDIKMINLMQFRDTQILLVDENTSKYLLSNEFKERYRGINLDNRILIGFKKKY